MVITDAGVPGMRINVAVIRPPLIAPTYMPIRSASALAGSMLKVSGRVSAIIIAPVMPGMAPPMMPSSVPMNTKASGTGARIWKIPSMSGVMGAYPVGRST